MSKSSKLYCLWFWGSETQLFKANELKEVSKRYNFDLNQLLRWGEVDFDDNDGNGVYGGIFEMSEC
jgi:hypothetical protein